MIGRTERRMAIIDAVAAEYGVTRDRIMAKDSRREIVRARDAAIARIRSECGDSMPQIAAFLGRSNHATIWAALNRQRKRATNAKWLRNTRARNMEARA